jgi:hypothetical protein
MVVCIDNSYGITRRVTVMLDDRVEAAIVAGAISLRQCAASTLFGADLIGRRPAILFYVERDCSNLLLRIRTHGFDQHNVLSKHAIDGRRIKQIGVMLAVHNEVIGV